MPLNDNALSNNSTDMPIPIAVPIAMGAASLVGGLWNSISGAKATSKTNALNYKMFKESQAYNTQMYNQQVADNRQNWQMQFDATNAYNDPAAQRQRLEDAGYNPYLAVEGSNSTGTASSSSISPASYSVPNAPNMQAPNYGPVGDALTNAVQQGLSTYIQLQQLSNQNKTTNANVDNTNAGTQSIIAGTQSTLEDVYAKQQRNKYAPLMALEDSRLKTMQRQNAQLDLELNNDTLKYRIDNQKQINLQMSNLNLIGNMDVECKRILTNVFPLQTSLGIMTSFQNLYNLYQTGRLTIAQFRTEFCKQKDLMAGVALKKAQTSDTIADIGLKKAQTLDTIADVGLKKSQTAYVDKGTEIEGEDLASKARENKLGNQLFDSLYAAKLKENDASFWKSVRDENRDKSWWSGDNGQFGAIIDNLDGLIPFVK
jgi:hypothetical protein